MPKMYFTSNLRNCIHAMKFVLRDQVCFGKCSLQRLSYTTNAVGSYPVKDDISSPENNFIRIYDGGNKNHFNTRSRYLLNSTDLTYTAWNPKHNTHHSHSHGHEAGSSSSSFCGQGWRLASLLALSLISTKTESEEEKKESELIILIKRGILALKVGCRAPSRTGGSDSHRL